MKKLILTLKTFVLILPLMVMAHQANARVDILPHMVVIEGRERSSEVTIINLSNKVNSYDLGILNYRQDENGVYTTLDTPLSPLFDPKDIVRMSPKEFTLIGLAKQKVRISLRKPADLPDGEYRFHILARGSEVNPTDDTDNGAQVSVKINVGVAIPVIVRHGNVSATGKLTDFKLVGSSKSESGKPEFEFLATREGNASTLGRVEAFWSPSGNENEYESIGFVTNFNLFTEINQRKGSIALSQLPASGKLKIVYSDTDSKEIYDEIIINP
jgi:P pilus assembly chaperone PapD